MAEPVGPWLLVTSKKELDGISSERIVQKCKNRSLVEDIELFVKSIEISDDIYPWDAVNIRTIQNGSSFFTSLTSLVTRTQLARPKVKGPLRRVGTL